MWLQILSLLLVPAAAGKSLEQLVFSPSVLRGLESHGPILPFSAKCAATCKELKVLKTPLSKIFAVDKKKTAKQPGAAASDMVRKLSKFLLEHKALAKCVAAHPGSCGTVSAHVRRLQTHGGWFAVRPLARALAGPKKAALRKLSDNSTNATQDANATTTSYYQDANATTTSYYQDANATTSEGWYTTPSTDWTDCHRDMFDSCNYTVDILSGYMPTSRRSATSPGRSGT